MSARVAILDNRREIAEERKLILMARPRAEWPVPLDEPVVFTNADDLIDACDRTREPDFFHVILTDVHMPPRGADSDDPGGPEDGGIRVKDWLLRKRKTDDDYRRVQLRWVTQLSDVRDIIHRHVTLEEADWLGWFPSDPKRRLDQTVLTDMVGKALRLACPVPLAAGTSSEYVYCSPAMREVMSRALQVARTSATVLIRGETGTGKEGLAAFIHRESGRPEELFVPVNCPAFNENLLESELFGHEMASFTGANRQRLGKFEFADGGTIFLDEIGDTPPLMQVKLLRVLQERRFERVGGNEPVAVDVRVIAATHKDLEALVRSGAFREDLYHRLNVFPIHLPPLRERREEVRVLADALVRKVGAELGKNAVLTPETVAALEAYHWPGNVRELESALARAVIKLSAGRITIEACDLELGELTAVPVDPLAGLPAVARDIYDKMCKTGFVQTAVARLRGCSRQSINQTIDDYPQLKELIARAKELAVAQSQAAVGPRRPPPPRPTRRVSDPADW